MRFLNIFGRRLWHVLSFRPSTTSPRFLSCPRTRFTMLIPQRRSNWLSKMTWILVREIVASNVYKNAQLYTLSDHPDAIDMTLFAQVWRIINNYWQVKADFFLIVHQGPETRQSYRGTSNPAVPKYVVLQDRVRSRSTLSSIIVRVS